MAQDLSSRPRGIDSINGQHCLAAHFTLTDRSHLCDVVVRTLRVQLAGNSFERMIKDEFNDCICEGRL